MNEKTFYERLGGYDAVSAVVNDLLPRLRGDPQLARFWQYRGEDSLKRSKQLLIDFVCSGAGGPLYYTGRDMKTSHEGMGISESDWSAFLGHLDATLEAFLVPKPDEPEPNKDYDRGMTDDGEIDHGYGDIDGAICGESAGCAVVL